jgi:phage anti-repressor protein
MKSSSNNGALIKDFIVTIEFAKHIAMMAKTQRVHDFSTWIKARIEKYEFVQEVDFVRLHKIVDGENKGFQPIEYFISLDMAKELSMVENNGC